jgi:hypothetical protein
MNAKRLLGTALGLGLGLAAVTLPTDVHAQGKPKGKSAAPAPPASAADAPMTKKPIKIWPSTLAWGMSMAKVAAVYDKVFDQDYEDDYKKAQPGIQMEELDAEIAEKKSEFRRSRIDFGKLPTGIDSTLLRLEYTYNNKESMMQVTRNGYTRYFFFIQDRLWKIIDERKVGEGKKWGKDFKDTTGKLAKAYGVAPKMLPPSSEVKRISDEAVWRDATSHLRLAPRGDGKIYVIYEDARTAENIDAMRTTKPAEEEGIDPAVKGILMGSGDSKDGPPDPKKQDPKKKK